MGLCDIVDELLDEHGLAHASATEKADLATFQIGFQEVDDLDSGKEHLLGGSEVLELWRVPVDGKGVYPVHLTHAVNGVSGDIHHAATDLGAYRHGYGPMRVLHLQAAAEAVRGVHGNGAHGVFSYVLLHLNDNGAAIRALHFQCIPDAGKL